MPLNLALGKLRQGDQEFKASPGYIVRPCLKNKTKQKKKSTYGKTVCVCLRTKDNMILRIKAASWESRGRRMESS
jgi:hypothetical protein